MWLPGAAARLPRPEQPLHHIDDVPPLLSTRGRWQEVTQHRICKVLARQYLEHCLPGAAPRRVFSPGSRLAGQTKARAQGIFADRSPSRFRRGRTEALPSPIAQRTVQPLRHCCNDQSQVSPMSLDLSWELPELGPCRDFVE